MFSTLGCHKLRSDLEALKGSQYVSVASYAIGNVSEAPIMTPLPLSSKLVVLVEWLYSYKNRPLQLWFRAQAWLPETFLPIFQTELEDELWFSC